MRLDRRLTLERSGWQIVQRQIERERAALIRRAAEPDLAAEESRQLSADRQAKSGAAVLSARASIGLLECFENNLLLLRRNSDARVAHRERNHRLGAVQRFVAWRPAFLGLRNMQRNNALLGELERVGQQVLENL